MTPEQFLQYDLPLFAGITPEDMTDIALHVTEMDFAPWQTVFDQQDTSNDVFFLVSGALLAVYWTAQGREIVFSRFPKGAYFGEMAALAGPPRSLAVFAKSSAAVLCMRQDSFLQLFNDVAVIRNRIVGLLIDRIRDLTERNMEMTTLSVEQRVSSYLLRLASLYGEMANGCVINDAPTHAEIAGSIGANREMVSRSISKLVKRGAIKSARKKIQILDPDALTEILIKMN